MNRWSHAFLFMLADDSESGQQDAPAGTAKYEQEDPSVASPAEMSNNKRVPIDTLARLFPQTKRTVLRSTLDRCDGDVLRAIEQLVYHNNNPQPDNEPRPASGQSAGQKRKTSESPAGHREKVRYQPHHQHHQHIPALEQHTFSWKNCLPMAGNPFQAPGSPAGSTGARPPMFPMQSSYFPAFGYGASSFLAGSFLRPDYPVFPGMSLLGSAAGSAPSQGSLDSISPAAYVSAYGHPAGAGSSMLHHSISPTGVKQEADINAINESHSSPHSDRSERSPYSDWFARNNAIKLIVSWPFRVENHCFLSIEL